MSTKLFFQRAAVTAILAAAGCMVGCDEGDPIDAEIRRADLILGSLTSGGYTPIANQERKREDLNWVIKRLSGQTVAGLPTSLSGKGVKELPASAREGLSLDVPTLTTAPIQSEKPSQQAAALLLVSRAQGGLAEMQSKEQVEKESALLNQVAVVRSAIEEWTALSALARGFESYDPANDIADLRQKIETKRQELGTLTQQKSAMDAKIADLTARASAATAAADGERSREAEVRARMSGASETQRAALLQEATIIKRAGDAQEREAANLLAEAAKDQPAAEVLQRQVSLAQEQIRLNEENIQGLEARATKGREAASKARQDAGQAQQRLSKLVADAKALRTNADGPANEAIRLYEQALGGAKKAQTALSDPQSKGAASAAIGGFSQSIGDVHAARSRGLFQFSLVLKSAASGEFALPESSTYGSEADALLQQSKDARKSAYESYTEALNAFEKAGLKDRAEEVKKKLEQLAALFNDNKQPAGDAASGGEAGAGEGGTAPAEGEGASADAGFDKAAVEAEVRAAMQSVIDAAKAGDTAALLSAMVFEDAAEGEFFQSAAPMGAAMASLNSAAQAKFGNDLKGLISASKVDAVKANPVLMMLVQGASGMTGAAGLQGLSDVSAADLTITPESAERAQVGAPGADAGSAMKAEKRDGAWKIVIAKTGMLDGPMAGQMKMMVPMFAKATTAMNEVAAGVNESKYADGDAMLIDLSTKLMGAMGGMGGGPGGG